jgi:hypothetical protein
MFPDSLESKIIREFKTDVPTQSYQHTKKSSMTVYRNRLRLTAVMNSVNLMFLFVIGHVVALPISSLERCFFDIISWVVIGYSVFFQAVLFQDNILVALFVYVSLVIAVGTFIYYYYKSACRLRSGRRAGVISIRSIYEKEKIQKNVSRLVSPQQQIMSGVVEKLRNHTRNRYSPRYERIMGALKSAVMDVDDKDKESGLDCPRQQHSLVSELTTIHFVNESRSQVAINFDISSSSDDGHVEDDESINVRTARSVEQRRTQALNFKKLLLDDLGVDLSDSDDSYQDLEDEFSYEFSSDSVDCESDGIKCSTVERSASFGGSTMAPDARVESIQRHVIDKIFTKPMSVKPLAQRIRKKRDMISKLSLKRHAQSIEDAFIYSTGARRASTLIHRERAHTKLQKRIENKKTVTSPEEQVRSDLISIEENGNNRIIGKLSSFELFDEKKNILKKFAAHDTLYQRSRLGQQQEAKASLHHRRTTMRNKKVNHQISDEKYDRSL